MLRICLLAVLVGALAICALALPTAALAGTFDWNLSSEFTATGSGANPDHDQYGATPWTYEVASQSGSHDPTTFTSLPSFATGVHGGLAAWSDPTSGALVGINPTSSAITDGSATYPAGQIVAEPGSTGQFVVIGWTSPLTSSATITINSSLTPDTMGSGLVCDYSTAWSLDQNGTSLVQGTTTTSTTSFSTSTTVDPGGSVYLTIATPPADVACDATEVSLQIQAPGTAPAVTLTKPTAGTMSAVTDPTFGGAAATGFGDSNQVTLRVYSGSAATGTAVQTLTATVSAGSWAVTPSTPLADGTYTAQAEQDDRASPADQGLSPPVTFTVVVGPTVTISSLGSKPLTTSQPVLTGTAGAAAGDDSTAYVYVFAGSSATGTAVRKLTAPVTATGTYSVTVTPALPDGVYTAVTAQTDSVGGIGVSGLMTFSVDARPPGVRLLKPARSARVEALNLIFTGVAGTAYGDSGTVTVSVYRGSKVKGRPVAVVRTTASGSAWTATPTNTLAPGLYTARASQGDIAGQSGLSSAHTFRILRSPPVVGKDVTIAPGGRVRVKVACNEPAGDTCTGTVTVVTEGDFQPVPGGPLGRLSLIFAHVTIEGGHNHTVSQVAPAVVTAALRADSSVPVRITANLRPVRGPAIHAAVRRQLRHVA